MSISNPIDALKNIAPHRVDGHDEFRDRRRSRHEALGRIEVGRLLVGTHRVRLAPHPLQEVASTVGPTRAARREVHGPARRTGRIGFASRKGAWIRWVWPSGPRVRRSSGARPRGWLEL
jgi:hypothetical protein